MSISSSPQFNSVQSLSCVQFFATPWTAAHQASLSFATSQSLLKFTSIESVMSSNHLILCRPLLLLPSIFSNESALCIPSGQNIGASASAQLQEEAPQWCQLQTHYHRSPLQCQDPRGRTRKEEALTSGRKKVDQDLVKVCSVHLMPFLGSFCRWRKEYSEADIVSQD